MREESGQPPQTTPRRTRHAAQHTSLQRRAASTKMRGPPHPNAKKHPHEGKPPEVSAQERAGRTSSGRRNSRRNGRSSRSREEEEPKGEALEEQQVGGRGKRMDEELHTETPYGNGVLEAVDGAEIQDATDTRRKRLMLTPRRHSKNLNFSHSRHLSSELKLL